MSTPTGVGGLRRLDAVIGGPVWWAVHLGGSYWLAPRACEWGASWPLHLLTLVLLALIARAWLSGWQVLRSGRSRPESLEAPRDVFLGLLGIALSTFFGAVTVAEWVPALSIPPCH